MSYKEIWSVKQVREILIRMNNCQNVIQNVTFHDNTVGQADCCMDVLCPTCQEDFESLLEWAEDSEDKIDSRQLELPI